MSWLWSIIDPIKWKIEDAIWYLQDKIKLHKELKAIDQEWNVEEIEVKAKKKKAKKKSVKKTKKSV